MTSIYRFMLTRRWSSGGRRLGVVMANPSTADDANDDATIRSLTRIAQGNGFDELAVANVSPFRATEPADLVEHIDGIDVWQEHENNRYLDQLARRCEQVVCAWGAVPSRHPAFSARAWEVRDRLVMVDGGRLLWCFGRTKDGWPKHPLFLPQTTRIVPYVG